MTKEFVVQSHPVVEELKLLNLEKTSPIEALNKLYELKEKVRLDPKGVYTHC